MSEHTSCEHKIKPQPHIQGGLDCQSAYNIEAFFPLKRKYYDEQKMRETFPEKSIPNTSMTFTSIKLKGKEICKE